MLLSEFADVFSGKLLSRYTLDDTDPKDPKRIYVLSNGSSVSRGRIVFHNDQWKTINGMEKTAALAELKKREKKTSFLADEHDVIIKPTAPSYAVYIDEDTAKKGILVSSAFLIIKCSEQKLREKLVEICGLSDSSRAQIDSISWFANVLSEWKEALSKYICVYLSLKYDEKELETTDRRLDNKGTVVSKADEDTASKEQTPKKREMIRAEDLRREDIPLFSESLDSLDMLRKDIAKMKKAYEIFMLSNEVINTLEELKKAELRRVRAALFGDSERMKDITGENKNG